MSWPIQDYIGRVPRHQASSLLRTIQLWKLSRISIPSRPMDYVSCNSRSSSNSNNSRRRQVSRASNNRSSHHNRRHNRPVRRKGRDYRRTTLRDRRPMSRPGGHLIRHPTLALIRVPIMVVPFASKRPPNYRNTNGRLIDKPSPLALTRDATARGLRSRCVTPRPALTSAKGPIHPRGSLATRSFLDPTI